MFNSCQDFCIKVQQIRKYAGHFIFIITPHIQFVSLLLYSSLSQPYLAREHFRTRNTRTETTRGLLSNRAQWRIQNCFHTDRFRNAIFKHTRDFTDLPFFAVPSWVVKFIPHSILSTSRAVFAVPADQSDTLCERLTARSENCALVALSSKTPFLTLRGPCIVVYSYNKTKGIH